MSRPRRHATPPPLHDTVFAASPRKAIPNAFVLEAIASLSPRTRPMFGCLAAYVEDKIVFVLRDKPGAAADNGMWLATTKEHHQSHG